MFKFIKKLLGINTISWMDYLAEPEIQKYQTFDTMSCTSQAVINSLEAQFNYLMVNKKLDNIEFLKENGYIKNGKIQFSKRYIARLSGTTTQGNSVKRVIDTILKNGLIPEAFYTYEHADSWDKYYTKIEPVLISMGHKFLEHFDIASSWHFTKDFKEELKKSPAVVIVYAWRKLKGVYYKPKNKKTNHAVSLIALKNNNYIIKDSYKDFIKEVKQGIYAGYFFKVFMKKEDLTAWLLENDLKTIRNSDTGEFGYCIHGVISTLNTTEEKLNALLDMRNRGLIEGGININNKTWEKLPKTEFRKL